MSAQEAAERRLYLCFSFAGNDYAIGVLQAKEILQYDTVTRIPSVPPSIRGVINLRGAVVPVIDLAVKLGLPETAVTKRTCILIVEVDLRDERTVMGVMAEAVQEVLELGPEDIEPPPSFGTQIRVDYLVGMGKAGKGFVLLLDLDRVISAGEKELAAHLEKPEESSGEPAAVAQAQACEAGAEAAAP